MRTRLPRHRCTMPLWWQNWNAFLVCMIVARTNDLWEIQSMGGQSNIQPTGWILLRNREEIFPSAIICHCLAYCFSSVFNFKILGKGWPMGSGWDGEGESESWKLWRVQWILWWILKRAWRRRKDWEVEMKEESITEVGESTYSWSIFLFALVLCHYLTNCFFNYQFQVPMIQNWSHGWQWRKNVCGEYHSPIAWLEVVSKTQQKWKIEENDSNDLSLWNDLDLETV